MVEAAIRRGGRDDLYRVHSFLGQVHNWFGPGAKRWSLREHEAFEEVRAGYWRAWKLWREAIIGHASKERWWPLYLANGNLPLCRDADEAFAISRQLVTESVGLFKDNPQNGVLGMDGL